MPKEKVTLSPKPTTNRLRTAICALLHISLLTVMIYHIYLAMMGYYANTFYLDDIGKMDYVLYNTWHGRFFWIPRFEHCFLVQHFTPSLLLLVPFHAIVRHMLFVPILQIVSMVSASWAVAWLFDGLVRRGRRTGHGLSPTGLALGCLFATNVLTGSILISYHFESFGVALSLWAMAALVNRRMRLFWILLIIAVGFKEDFPLYWAWFGLWWIAFGSLKRRKPTERRNRMKTGLRIFAACVGLLLLAMVAMKLAMLLSNIPETHIEKRYDWMGLTLRDKIITFFTSPKLVWWWPLRNGWWVGWTAVFFLPILAPESILLLIPGAYVMGLGDFIPGRYFHYYYSYPLVPFLFYGVALSVARFVRVTRRFKLRDELRGAIIAGIFLLSCFVFTLPTRPADRLRKPEKPTARHTWMRDNIRKLIPPDASVAAQFDLFCQVPYRTHLYALDAYGTSQAEYWIFDYLGFPGDINLAKERDVIINRANELEQAGKGKTVLWENQFLIFRRNLEKP